MTSDDAMIDTDTPALADAQANMYDAGAVRTPPWLALVTALASIRPDGIGATIDWLVAHRDALERAYVDGRTAKLAAGRLPPEMRYEPELGFLDRPRDDHALRDKYLFVDLAGKRTFFQAAVYAMTGREITGEQAAMLDEFGITNLLVDRGAWPMTVTRRVGARGRDYGPGEAPRRDGPIRALPRSSLARRPVHARVAAMSAQQLLLASVLAANTQPPPDPTTSAGEGQDPAAEQAPSPPLEAAPAAAPEAPGASEAVASSVGPTPAAASRPPDGLDHGGFWGPPRRQPSRRQLAGKAPISVRLKTLGELGSLNVLSHTLQFDKGGTTFDLRRDGRQDTMFLFRRLSAELEIDDHHQIILLYQPIRFETETVLKEDLVADDVTFPALSGVSILYGFDIYRLSYAYDFFTDPEQELALGFSMQVRNFRQSYVSSDGEQSVANTNIGAVPILKLRGRHQLKRVNFWYGGEIDGFYANIPYVNGGDDPVEGLIVDASLRAGVTVARALRPFANLRYLGGGGKGTSSDKVGFGDGYSSNWLHTLAFSLGAELTIPAVVGDRRARDREIAARKAKRRARRAGG